MSKHTKGPWRLVFGHIQDKDSNTILHQSAMMLKGKMTAKEMEANAKLIAAAPELLEALKDLVSRATYSEEKTSVFIKAKEAIAKAEGEI